MKKVIFSIGHGSRRIDDFISLLKKYNINYLIDVRSSPYSKYNPQYNINELKSYLEAEKISYVFMGDALGGRPKEQSCYDKDGKVDYSKLKVQTSYQEGIERLKKANANNIKVAIMCSESKPAECHRSKLIGMSLYEDKDGSISIAHIDENGRLKDQATVMNELNKGKNEVDLFNSYSNNTSRKSYIQ